MMKLIWLITIVAAAGGGYWLGQRPNSPLIFEWAGRQIEEFDNRGGTKWIISMMSSIKWLWDLKNTSECVLWLTNFITRSFQKIS